MPDSDGRPAAPVANASEKSDVSNDSPLLVSQADNPAPASLFQIVGIETEPPVIRRPEPPPVTDYGPPEHNPQAFISVPVSPLMFMRGGTSSSKYDRDMAELNADAERRQAEDAAERRKHVKMPEQGKGNDAAAQALRESVIGSAIAADKGVSYNHDMASQAPVCIIEMRSKDKAHHRFCQADLVVVEANGKPVPALVIVCPRCVERGVKQKFAQLTLRQDNRKWYLDEKWKGQTWVDPETNEAWTIAGVVEMPELAKCDHPQCDFRFRINASNREHPMTSLLVAEL